MNIVVTGGAGFIGSHLVRRLVSDGHRITVIDDLVRGRLANLNDVREKIDFVNLDICDHDGLGEVLRGADGIFHQAALGSVPESYENYDRYERVNVGGTENVFRIARESRTKVVYASSSSVYGNVQRMPITEDFERRPLNPYGRTKLDGEIIAERYAGTGSRIIGLRYFNVFGAGQNPNYAGVISKFLDRLSEGKPPIIFGDGSQIRDFTFIDDVVGANLAAMSSDVGYGFFNVGGGRSTSLKDLARMMIKIAGLSLEPQYDEPRQGDPMQSTADISKSAKLLGWRPKVTVEEGLRKLFRDYASSSAS